MVSMKKAKFDGKFVVRILWKILDVDNTVDFFVLFRF